MVLQTLIQSHTFSRPLLAGATGSRAIWSVGKADTAIIFIHGFAGSATGTWLQFPAMLMNCQKAQSTDLIFYGYDGLRTRSQISALSLLQFLDIFLSNPATHINNTMHARDNFTYKRVIFVAHSLGSIVTRRVLLDAERKSYSWFQQCEMVLFAPAHMGADIMALALSALTGLRMPGIAALGPAAKGYCQVLNDLEPGCQTLQQLLTDTQSSLGHRPNAPHLVARKVLLGNSDRVVSPNRFAQDPVPELLNGSHISICKPNNSFTDPIGHLCGIL